MRLGDSQHVAPGSAQGAGPCEIEALVGDEAHQPPGLAERNRLLVGGVNLARLAPFLQPSPLDRGPPQSLLGERSHAEGLVHLPLIDLSGAVAVAHEGFLAH